MLTQNVRRKVRQPCYDPERNLLSNWARGVASEPCDLCDLLNKNAKDVTFLRGRTLDLRNPKSWSSSLLRQLNAIALQWLTDSLRDSADGC